MYYNGDERIFWMRLNAGTGKDIPFVGNAKLPEGVTNVYIVHDFKYGWLNAMPEDFFSIQIFHFKLIKGLNFRGFQNAYRLPNSLHYPEMTACKFAIQNFRMLYLSLPLYISSIFH